MKIQAYSLGQLQANCYFLIQDEECLIIDPADEASFILEELQRRKLKLVGMLATHGHFDHIMAAGEIQISDDVPFYIHQNDLFLVKRLNETAEYFLGFNPHSLQPKLIKHLKEGKFEVGSWKFELIHTPGHTPGSCCFYLPAEASAEVDFESPVIFTGDTLFKQGIGRYDFSYSNEEDLKKSLEKLLKLPKDTIVYPGHEEQSTIGKEMEVSRSFF